MEAQTMQSSNNTPIIPTTHEVDASLSNCEVVACGTVVASTPTVPSQMPSQSKKPRGCSKRLSMDERYRVRELYCNGIPKLRIARMLNLNWRTVQKIAKKVDAGITDLSPLRPSRTVATRQNKTEILDGTEVASTSNFQPHNYNDVLQISQSPLPQQNSILVLNGLPSTELNGKKFPVSEDELQNIKEEYLTMKQETDELTEAMEEETSSISVKSELKDDLDDHIIDVVTPEPEERRVRTKKSVAEALRAKRAAALGTGNVSTNIIYTSTTEANANPNANANMNANNTVHRILVPLDQVSARYSILMKVKCVCWYDVGFTLQDIVRLFEAEFGEEFQAPPLEIIKFWHERLCTTGSVV